MLNKEELKNTYIKYDSSITEEIFNKILKIAKDFQEKIGPGFKPYDIFENNFKNFCNNGFFWFGPIGNVSYGVDNNEGYQSIKQIYPKDILEEEIQQYLPVGHPDLIVKKLTVDDLVEGEFYYCTTNNREKEWVYIYKKDKYLTDHNGCIVMYKSYYPSGFRYIIEDSKVDIIKPADALQKKWLKTCIKQDKFIPQSELYKYDEEGNLIENNFKVGDYVVSLVSTPYGRKKNDLLLITGDETYNIINSSKKERFDESISNEKIYSTLRFATPEEIAKVTKQTFDFEFNKWYKSNNADGLFFVQSENTGYGFRSNHKNYWFTRTPDMGNWDLAGLIPATNEGVQERLLNFAKEKYPIGTKMICTNTTTEKVISGNLYNYYTSSNRVDVLANNDNELAYLFDGFGKWAEIISEPTKETKTFDRNWYVEVNSQEEADLVFDWLKSKGEPVLNSNGWLNFRNNIDKYISYWKKGGTWFVNNCFEGGYYLKQLSDILPNYPKVNRDVYYKVENQEQYNEILDWLREKGEPVFEELILNYKGYILFWKAGKKWAFNDTPPNRPKAEFQFKNKHHKFGDIRGMGAIDMEPNVQKGLIKPIPEVETVINRFKAQPIKKRVLPEIY